MQRFGESVTAMDRLEMQPMMLIQTPDPQQLTQALTLGERIHLD
jgi:hypothetical protein